MLIITSAPLRIPLGGGGTDFPSYYEHSGGYILGFAINSRVTVVLHDTIDGKIRLKYSKVECVDDVDALENRVAAEALKYFGVLGGIEIATFSDVPESSGLGGSSAFCVALVAALRQRLGKELDKKEIFLEAYEIERHRAGQLGGFQDQWFASLGGAFALDFGPDWFNTRRIDIRGLLPNLKLVYSNTGRTSLDIASRQVERTSQDDTGILLNLNTIKAIGQEIEAAILSRNYDKVGRLFHEHWENKKARDSVISNSEVDRLYELGRKAGASGGKLLGLGGGGYLLFYAPNLNGFQCIDFDTDYKGVQLVHES